MSGLVSAAFTCLLFLLLFPNQKNIPPIIAITAIAPITMPAIAPPEIPELDEDTLLLARLVDVAALPVGASDAVVVAEAVPVVLAVDEDALAEEVAAARFLVLNGVGAVL